MTRLIEDEGQRKTWIEGRRKKERRGRANGEDQENQSSGFE